MIWLYSINEEGKVSSITDIFLIYFLKQLYGQEICGEKMMEPLTKITLHSEVNLPILGFEIL